MYQHWLMFSLASVGWLSADGECDVSDYATAYKDLYKSLDLDKNYIQMVNLRPVPSSHTYTSVYVGLYVSSITNVNEKEQSFSTQVRIYTVWTDDSFSWSYDDYCGMRTLSARKDQIWTPYLGITESIKTEYATMESQYALMIYDGDVLLLDALSLTTACIMDLYRFPFDIQSCNITLQSSVLSSQELRIKPLSDEQEFTDVSKQSFKTQGEWELLSVNYSRGYSYVFGHEFSKLIFKVTIKRRPLLYVINFMLPVFYFLVLDVASFFMDASGADKLSFKVTLLLSISVLLLILNDTLPSTASEIPLIGVYCSVIFTFIGISILETMLVDFLMTRGAETRSAGPVETTAAITGQDDVPIFLIDGVRDSRVIDGNVEQSRTLNSLKTPLCWTRVAKIIDVTFRVLYIITIIVFLSMLGKVWYSDRYPPL
ncbi:5-hydroxytryptamine receptor 3A-like [Myxocyprinus asiaticus]|uniref:5-hydroxytryptamine receptor 3A-like n=1 Tax=Myxocyprinus asiaticus TaxID=70543 RepID=UPI002221C471|nr:5-hydroxytryptamine receptor 3A-like [Myxocyprinus asiaticus]